MQSLVPLEVIESVPLQTSLADTDTAVPVLVPPLIYPAVFVTDGVTEIAWLLTAPFDAVGVPSVPLETDLLALLA